MFWTIFHGFRVLALATWSLLFELVCPTFFQECTAQAVMKGQIFYPNYSCSEQTRGQRWQRTLSIIIEHGFGGSINKSGIKLTVICQNLLHSSSKCLFQDPWHFFWSRTRKFLLSSFVNMSFTVQLRPRIAAKRQKLRRASNGDRMDD